MRPVTLLRRTGDGAFGSIDCAAADTTVMSKMATANNFAIIRRKAYQICVILVL